MQDARGRAQVRVQHVLPRLHQRRALLPVPRLPPRPPRHPDKEVLVPRRDPRVGDPEGAGYHRRADLHHQQRARRLPQRAPAAQARQGRHQHLRRLRAQPPRHLPLLLPRMQDRGHLRRVPRAEEARRRQEDEAEAEEGGGVGLGRLVHHHQRRERQEQRCAELLPVHPAGHRQQLPLRQAAQGHPAPLALRQPHRGVLEQSSATTAPSPSHRYHCSIHVHPSISTSRVFLFYSVPFYTPRRRRRSLSKKNNEPPLPHLCASGRGGRCNAMRDLTTTTYFIVTTTKHSYCAGNRKEGFECCVSPERREVVAVVFTLVVA